jgi:hypothetical protein
LFTESGSNRGFDVLVDGVLIADAFNPGAIAGIDNTPDDGVVLTYDFRAIDNIVNIMLTGVEGSFPDNNPILSGLTLEETPEPASLVIWTVAGLAGVGLMLARRRWAAKK